MITYKITDQEKFDEANVVDIETNGMRRNGDTFHGTLSIEIEGQPIDANRITGEHGASDYEDEYGFVLTDLK